MATGFALCLGELIPEKMCMEAGSGEEAGNSDQAPGSPQIPLPASALFPQALGEGVPSSSNMPGLGWGPGSQTGAVPALESRREAEEREARLCRGSPPARPRVNSCTQFAITHVPCNLWGPGTSIPSPLDR